MIAETNPTPDLISASELAEKVRGLFGLDFDGAFATSSPTGEWISRRFVNALIEGSGE